MKDGAAPLSLASRVALVVGATTPIGAATARGIAAAGASVGLVDREGEALASLAAEIAATGSSVVPLSVDLLDPAEAGGAVARTVARFGGLHVLVHAALPHATLGDRGHGQDTESVAARVVDAARAWAQAASQPMIEAGHGRILSLTSIVARYGLPGQTALAASSGAIISMTRVWARELGSLGITANAVAPGLIGDDPDCPVPRDVLPRIPAGRAGTAQEVANVFLFLASEEAAFVNGAVVGVDGGLLL